MFSSLNSNNKMQENKAQALDDTSINYFVQEEKQIIKTVVT